ncbi:MAG TPA: HPr family phosphocarrier protein [Pirellulaceae bacterium]|nr:HPr family phosphocarrier protein [Pirellulaceae bacterium]HMO93716.1 HPr family phosphocarrier protein [Pirellulaceae bacterium]HMP69781.1 HPr family phosphocarrier protein [Pirellulaceae bacterium]
MPNPTLVRAVVINNPQGMHMRPAHLFAELAKKYVSQIEIIKNGSRIDGKSVLSILTLCAMNGESISLEATGPDAEEAVNALAELVNNGFTFDQGDSNTQKVE